MCWAQAENILLDEKDMPVVADFGLATAVDPEDPDRKTGIQGTLGHIAPGNEGRFRYQVQIVLLCKVAKLTAVHPHDPDRKTGIQGTLGHIVPGECFSLRHRAS